MIAPSPTNGILPSLIPWNTLSRAKRLMRGIGGGRPMDLHEAAAAVGVLSRDLDLTLWRNLGVEADWDG